METDPATNIETAPGLAFGVHRAPLRGHMRTVWPILRDRVWRTQVKRSQPWHTTVHDPKTGALRLTGQLRQVPGAESLVVLVHGLGGSPDSVYMRGAAITLARAGYSTLRLALRGADRRGEDFYNIALTADLHAALQSPELKGYRHLYVLGFSMGGHVALHLACDPPHPRLRAVAALCTPLDLGAAQRHIDSPHVATYRRWVLGGLKQIYTAVAARRAVPSPVAEVQAVETIYDWDRLTIAPRYGYRDPEHYYSELSIAPRLPKLRSPALLVLAEDDPMVPLRMVEPFLPGPSSPLEFRRAPRSGHVAFPGRLDLGLSDRRGLVPQVLSWFRSHA